MWNKKKQQGFSLTELMVTLVIIGIIASIAVPSYSAYVKKARRSEAKADLLAVSSQLERYFYNNRAYTTVMSDLGHPGTTESGYYTVAVALSGVANLVFLITATASGGQAGDTDCNKLMLSSTGEKTAENSSGAVVTDCW